MKTHIIEQEQNDIEYNWIAVDEETAHELWEKEIPLYYVREDAEGLIEFEEDLNEAIENNAVCPEDSYLWRSDFEEGLQNRFRNNDFTSFETWCGNKINSLLE